MKYYIEKEERLSKLTKRLGITSGQLRKLNPQMKILGGLSGGIYVQSGQTLNLPADAKMPAVVSTSGNARSTQANEEERKKLLEKLEFGEAVARYRAKQINIIKINNVISAHSTVKYDYCFALNREKKIAQVYLNDSVYNFYTNGSEYLEDFVRVSDKVKKKMIYSIETDGSIKDLLNHKEIQKNWQQLRKEIPRHKAFSKINKNMLNQIVKAGDDEYNSKPLLIRNSNNNLFNRVLFSQYLTRNFNDFEVEEFETISHFFPQVGFTVNCKTQKTKENTEETKYEKKGTPFFVDIDQMILLYEQNYKKQVEFKFTDYLYDYESYFTVSNKDRLIDYATVSINERVKNNLQSEVIYELKRVEL